MHQAAGPVCCTDMACVLPNYYLRMDIVQIVIYNLRLRRREELLAEGKPVDQSSMYFRFKEDICYFIDKNWARVCFGKSSKSLLDSC